LTRKRKWIIASGTLGAVICGLWVLWLVNRPALIAVGSRSVEARIRGTGAPTVIFELGAAGGDFTYWRVQNAVAKHAATLVYERAGLGRSSLGAEPRSAEIIAIELHDLLVATKLPRPYILVGHSYGGLLIRVFAHKYTEDVAGMVFVDPATEGVYAFIQAEYPKEWKAAETMLGEGFRRQTVSTPLAMAQAAAALPLPQVPTVIFTAQKIFGQWPLATAKDMQVMEQEHQWLSTKLPGSTRIKLPDASHMSILLKDRLAEEIIKVVERSRRPIAQRSHGAGKEPG
jgi:pimeloyl-ACP methyl ester carboxylesterase